MPSSFLTATLMEPDKLSPRQFELFRDFIYRKCGIRIEPTKVTLLTNRIRRRVKARQLPDFDAYYRFLVSPAGLGELEHFLDEVTTNETSFFRTPHHFEWFKGPFLDELLARPATDANRRLRVWSAACSTGEEPYSIAICLADSALKLRDWKTSILATDLSEAVLRQARAGIYRPRSLQELSEARLKRYFDQQADGESYAIRSQVKSMVEFRHHNLIEHPTGAPFDCIFIRNVLIYFDRPSKQVVINHLVNALAPGGYLIVGPSEGIYDMLGMLTKHSHFAYQKPFPGGGPS
ncbi:MAG: CheR family methyltransferase [Planctomycetaceae bacterium]